MAMRLPGLSGQALRPPALRLFTRFRTGAAVHGIPVFSERAMAAR